MNRVVVMLGLSMLIADSASPQEVSELLPREQPIHAVVDHYLGAHLKEAEITPAPQAHDANVLRRTMLDLVGRIPTAGEAKAYVELNDSNKRAATVDRLLASAGFVRHQANELNTMLMGGGDTQMLEYLRTAVAENRSWDQVFREIIAAEKGAEPFLKSRIRDLDGLTNDASVIFFGVNVSCAQCHDHPLVPEWTQSHFYGMKSFFGRTFENGGFLGERDYGQVKFTTTEGEEKTARLMFLTGSVLDEPEAKQPSKEAKQKEKKLLEKLKKEKKAPPPPEFSRREQLAKVALSEEENEYFSRAIVNRLWYRLFGRGLVNPVDQMHPENPPSHPELMDWLARDLVEHDYDLRRLLRGLVLSKAYSRSSRWQGEEYPSPSLFAIAKLRPLTPSQYATTLRLASMAPDWFPEDIASDDFSKRIEQVANSARGFSRLIEQPGDDFQVSVTEALLFNNNQRIRSEFLRDAGDSLVGTLKKTDDPAEIVSTAVWNVFARPVAEEEAEILRQHFSQYEDDNVVAAQQLVWALLTSGEVRFNY